MSSLASTVALRKAEQALLRRLGQLEERVTAGDESAWQPYCEAVKALAALIPALQPENGGAMLTTGEMAARLGVVPKTLLRRKSRGEIRPVVEQGKLLRWSGRETLSRAVPTSKR